MIKELSHLGVLPRDESSLGLVHQLQGGLFITRKHSRTGRFSGGFVLFEEELDSCFRTIEGFQGGRLLEFFNVPIHSGFVLEDLTRAGNVVLTKLAGGLSEEVIE